MDAASGCLVRSFSQPSPSFCDYKEEDPFRALTSSISFGRFMSEPLAWEKWSSFNHNRNLEEIQKFSKPGSVAEKKAFFEARYKKIAAKKAAALLEQESEVHKDSPTLNATTEILGNSPRDSDLAKPSVLLDNIERRRNDAPRLSDELVSSVYPNVCNIKVEENVLGTAKVEWADDEKKQVVLSENQNHIQLEFCRQLENVEKHSEIMSVQEEKSPMKDAADHGDEVLSSSKNHALNSSGSSRNNEASKLQTPGKPPNPIHPRKEANATSGSKRTAKDLMYKRRAIPQSLHMSINLSSFAGESSNMSPPLPHKIGNPKIGNPNATSGSKRTAKDLMDKRRAIPQSLRMSINLSSSAGESSKMSPPLSHKIGNPKIVNTPKDKLARPASTRASVNGVPKHSLVLPQPENRRSRTLLDRSVLGSRTVVGKSQSLFINHSESSNTCAKKPRSPTVPSSFSFRSEERAAKRKEKLEEKPNTIKAEKVQLQTKSKDKTENDLKRMRQSTGLKAKVNTTSLHRHVEPPSNMKKILPTYPRSPKLGRTPTPITTQDTCYRPPWRSNPKVDISKNVVEKNKQTLSRSSTLLPKKKSMRENASPNIQVRF